MLDRAEVVGDPVLAAVADEEHVDLAELGVALGTAPGAGGRRPEASASAPASQCGPRIAHGTTCSRRQKTRAPLARRLVGAEPVVGLDRGAAPGALVASGAMAPLRIVALEGDQTGQELLEQALRVLDPDVLGLELELARFDLSLDNRRATENAVVHEAAAAMRAAGLGLKAATITPEGADDVGSPTASCARRSTAR